MKIKADSPAWIALIALVIMIAIGAYLYIKNKPAPIVCPMDAKVCADGSTVGRIAPFCDFAKCPGE